MQFNKSSGPRLQSNTGSRIPRKSESGQISRTLIILAVVVLCAIVLVYWITRIAAGNKAKQAAATEAQKAAQEQKVPEPVYEIQAGDVDFTFISAINLGNFISGKTASVAGQPDLTTTERFIKVTVGAENMGKADTAPYVWSIGNIVDSEGRNFVPIDDKAYYFLPKPDTCGAVLKPAFAPTKCTKIYEVSKASTKLQLQVNAYASNSSKQLQGVIDLVVK